MKLAKIGIGLDIGTSSVKIVEIEGGRTIRVIRFGVLPLPEGSLSGGVVNNSSAVSKVILDLYHQCKITRKNAALAIAGQAVIVRNIKMPEMTREELDNAIQWEIEKYIPFPADQVEMDYHIVQHDQEQKEMEIMLVCAHKDIINSHLVTLREVAVKPTAIDIQPFALMRALGLENSFDDNSTALLDIGAGTTDLTIVKKGIPRFTRIIPLAGNRLTEIISKRIEIPFAEAEQLKITLSDALFDSTQSSTNSPEQKVNFVLQEGLQELVLELRRSFDYYQLQQRNEGIKQLILAGGGAKMKNLISFLNKELDIPVIAAQAAMETISSDKKLQSDLTDMMPMLTVAYGLALREVTEE